ncbi:MAG: tetratricopeptide repeat protein [Flavicella sp.]
MNLFKQCYLVFLFLTTVQITAQNKKITSAFATSYTFQEQANYEAAIAEINKVYNEDSYEINLRLGWLHYLGENNVQAINYYKKASKIMPAATEPQWNMITVYTKTENWIEIEKQYLSIIELDPKNTSANYNLGLIYYYRKDFSRAKKYFDVALNIKPFGYNNLLMSAWTNYFLGNRNNASILFNKVLLYSPNDPSALEGLALMK